MPLFRAFMQRVRDLGLHEKCFIMAGVGPLASARSAKWIRANVPGIHIPDAIIARLEGAQNQKLEGKKICIEIMQECREIAGVVRRPCHGLPAGGAGGRDRARIGRAGRPPAVAPRGLARTTRASRERLGTMLDATDKSVAPGAAAAAAAHAVESVEPVA